MNTAPDLPMLPSLGRAGPGVCLVVDYGTATTRALVCRPDGQRLPLLTEQGDLHWPSLIAATSGHTLLAGPEAAAVARSAPDTTDIVCSDLKSRLLQERVQFGGRAVDPVDALAAVLTRLAGRARQVTGAAVGELVMTVSAGWGPRHRTVVRGAAQRAGLPPPQLVAVPAAVGWLLIASGALVPPGSMMLVCDAGHSAFEATLQVRTGGGFATLATARRPDAGGGALDRRMAEHCLTRLASVDGDLARRLRQPESVTDRRHRAVFDDQVHAAHEALAGAQAVSIPFPPPHPALTVTADQYRELMRPVEVERADTAREVVDAANVQLTDLVAAYAVGGALTGGTVTALQERGLSARIVPQPELAAVFGAADAPTPARPAPPRRGVSRRWRPVPALTALVAALCSLTLASHAIYTSTIGGYLHNFAVINWGEYTMGCCYALLAATALADTFTRPPAPRAGILGMAQIPRLAYAVLAAVLVSTGYALAGVTDLALPWSLPSYLAWALLPILPAATLAATVGVLRHHAPGTTTGADPAGRHRVVPVEGIALAAIGMILLQIPLQGADHPFIWYALVNRVGADAAGTTETLMGHLGALAIGVGAALVAATTLRARLLAVPAAALLTIPTPPFGLTSALGLAVVAAVTLWWARYATRLLISLTSRQHRLTPEEQHPVHVADSSWHRSGAGA